MTKPEDDAVKKEERLVEPWVAFAQNWMRVASPLRPCPEDLQRLQTTWHQSLPKGLPQGRVDVLILGVTPEFALFPWAESTSVRALDCSAAMIRGVWPGDGPNRQAVLGDWRAMPFADGSFDLIVCDNGMALLLDTPSLATAGQEMRRLLKKDGRVVMRHFARTAEQETVPTLVAATAAGKMANFHGLKLRLLFALEAETTGEGVRLADVWDCFQREFPDRDALAQRLGCDRDTIDTIDTYRERDGRYIFRPLAELARVFESFRMVEGPDGHYPFAENCPVFSLTPIA